MFVLVKFQRSFTTVNQCNSIRCFEETSESVSLFEDVLTEKRKRNEKKESGNVLKLWPQNRSDRSANYKTHITELTH